MIDSAFAGHAGEMTSPWMPHELAGALGLVVVIGLILLVIAVLSFRILLRIDRRLRGEGPARSSSQRPSDDRRDPD